jgi:hypothetical protein
MLNITLSANSANEKRASNSDRRWFARNQHRTYRVRPSLPDEFPWKRPDGIPATFASWTLVKQIEPGLRLRRRLFIRSGSTPVDVDRTLGPLYERVCRTSAPGLVHLGDAFLPPAHVAEGGVQ